MLCRQHRFFTSRKGWTGKGEWVHPWLLLSLAVESLALGEPSILSSLAQIFHFVVSISGSETPISQEGICCRRTLAIELLTLCTYSWLEEGLDSRERYHNTSRTIHMTAKASTVNLEPKLSIPDFGLQISKMWNRKPGLEASRDLVACEARAFCHHVSHAASSSALARAE